MLNNPRWESGSLYVLTEKTVPVLHGMETIRAHLFSIERNPPAWFTSRNCSGGELNKFDSVKKARETLYKSTFTRKGLILSDNSYVLVENLASPYYFRYIPPSDQYRVSEPEEEPWFPEIEARPIGFVDHKTLHLHFEEDWNRTTPMQVTAPWLRKPTTIGRKQRRVIRNSKLTYEFVYQLTNKRYTDSADHAKYDTLFRLYLKSRAKQGLVQAALEFLKFHGQDASDAVKKYLESRGEAKAGLALAAALRFLR